MKPQDVGTKGAATAKPVSAPPPRLGSHLLPLLKDQFLSGEWTVRPAFGGQATADLIKKIS